MTDELHNLIEEVNDGVEGSKERLYAALTRLEKQNAWFIKQLQDRDRLLDYFAAKIDSAHTECVIADARMELNSRERA